MGQALYRKYRSRSLDELVGQEHITNTLSHAIKAGRISHAYLFTGPRGTGKTSVARILAYAINGLPYSDTPHLDIIEIDAASNRRIDDIRDLREKVYITPVSAKYKVYIIDEVHMLTGESFNALLKTLEEPPKHVVFILATTEVHKLPATIISRTQRFSFRPGTRETIAKHLKNISEKENIHIDDEALDLIAEHSDGGFRDAVSLLDQISNISEKKITAEKVANILGLAPKKSMDLLVQAYIKHDVTGVTTILKELQELGVSSSMIVHQLSRVLLEKGPENPELFTLLGRLLEVPRAYNPDLKLLTVLLEDINTVSTLTNNMPTTQPKPEPKSAPAIATAPAPVTIAEVPKPSDRRDAEVIVHPDQPLASVTDAEWHQVLTALKKASPPVYSVAKQAQPTYDTTTNTLTLAFKYQLHRKKLDDPKQKALLTDIIATALGGMPVITTTVDTNATPPPPPPADPTVASVAAIMGGGEIIDASQTA